MEHKLKMRQNLPRKDKTLRTQMEQSSEYYAYIGLNLGRS